MTTHVPLDGYRVHADSPNVVWDFATPGLQLTRQATGSESRTLHALLGPPPKSWPKATETDIHNEYFGTRSVARDWLVTPTALGNIAARRRSDHWFEILIRLGETPCNVFEILDAITFAFGFVQGRRIFLLGFVDLARGREARYLRVPEREPTTNSLLKPLGDDEAYLVGGETLLGQAINFFLTDQGKRVAHYLYHCWDTADNAFSTHLAVASICVEGLLREFQKNTASVEELGYTAADQTSFKRWLVNNPDGLTSRFVSRLSGFLGVIGKRRPVDVLQDWQKRGLLGVTDDDIRAWKGIRNPSTHGYLFGLSLNPADLQTRLSRYYRVVNLINRIVLQLIGYGGRYVDYAHAQWREVEFPAMPQSDQ